MALALILLRAAHARGTHHYLALDALTHLTDQNAAGWQRLMHAEIALYVDGAKAPDTQFKDFQNHVLHPRDGYWGGAPERASHWYRTFVAALERKDWSGAVYAAGVLSHYVTDPLMPLHTHQTDAEANLHAAVERTVSKSYVRLRELGHARVAPEIAGVPIGPDWIGELLRAGASHATRHYETVLAHYDIKRGVVAPEEGFDPVGQMAIAEMLVAAARLFARILDRAFAEAGVAPPEISLTGPALAALATLPKAWWQKRQLDAAERAVVEAMYDELMATGRVEQALTEDDRQIRDLYQREVVARRGFVAVPIAVAPSPGLAKLKPRTPPVEAAPAAASPKTADPTLVPVVPPDRAWLQRMAAAPLGMAPIGGEAEVTIIPAEPVPAPAVAAKASLEPISEPEVPARDDETSGAGLMADASPALSAATAAAIAAGLSAPFASGQQSEPLPVPANGNDQPPTGHVEVAVPDGATLAPVLSSYRPQPRTRVRFTLDSEVVDAPSIGPKTAKRLNDVGIDTIGDFLKAHPIALAARLDAAHLTAEVLGEWQDQTHLMLRLPVLQVMHAQLLTGAGYRTVEAIAEVAADQLSADVLRFAIGDAGQRLLRKGGPPDIEQVRAWAEAARAAKAA